MPRICAPTANPPRWSTNQHWHGSCSLLGMSPLYNCSARWGDTSASVCGCAAARERASERRTSERASGERAIERIASERASGAQQTVTHSDTSASVCGSQRASERAESDKRASKRRAGERAESELACERRASERASERSGKQAPVCRCVLHWRASERASGSCARIATAWTSPTNCNCHADAS